MSETTESKKKVRRVRKTNVLVVRTNEERAIVEWIEKGDVLRRAFVGVDEIEDGKVANTVLKEAIPYGLPWEMAFEAALPVATPEHRANELRKAGIWTLDDLRTKSTVLLGALKAGFRVEIGELNALATKIRGGE